MPLSGCQRLLHLICFIGILPLAQGAESTEQRLSDFASWKLNVDPPQYWLPVIQASKSLTLTLQWPRILQDKTTKILGSRVEFEADWHTGCLRVTGGHGSSNRIFTDAQPATVFLMHRSNNSEYEVLSFPLTPSSSDTQFQLPESTTQGRKLLALSLLIGWGPESMEGLAATDFFNVTRADLYPGKCTWNMTERVVPIIIAFGCLLALMVVMVVLVKVLRPAQDGRDTSYALYIGVVCSMFDVATDILFAVSMHARGFMLEFVLASIFVVVPLLLQVVASWSLLGRELFAKKKDFSTWAHANIKVLSAAVFLSLLTGSRALELTASNLGQVDALRAPWSRKGMALLQLAGLLGVLLEDIPQLILQVGFLRWTGRLDSVTIVSVSATCIILIFTGIRHVVTFLVYRAQHANPANQPQTINQTIQQNIQNIGKDKTQDKGPCGALVCRVAALGIGIGVLVGTALGAVIVYLSVSG